MSTDETTIPNDTIPLAWDDLQAAVAAAGEGVFLATTGRDGRPHVAWVMPGWADERLWIATFASSQKAANLRANQEVAMTCAARPDLNVLIRATARIVEDRAETAELWAGGVLPYDPSAFFSGPDDPEALFVELRSTRATIHELGPAPVRRWRPR
jgi:general stress protein 26